MSEVFIGVGSNVEPEKNILRALVLLSSHVIIKALSTFYRTLPIDGAAGQPSFINGVIAVNTNRPPLELKFSVLRDIEKKLGRKRSGDRYAPRPIDLDIILYDTLVVNQPDLLIPDPSLYERPFLAIPLFQLAPHLVLPDSGMPIVTVVARHAENTMEPLFEYSDMLRKELADEH